MSHGTGEAAAPQESVKAILGAFAKFCRH